MQYRDLIPGRQGGYVIGSHIRIPDGGPVPDYVHYHEVRFQVIYCYKGWVRVIYEDQGDSFILHPGDCVLQPPLIRHRVLESSSGLEVIEIGCPAEHPTYVEHEMTLPTPDRRPERQFSGQRFVHHVASKAKWSVGEEPWAKVRDTGIRDATTGAGSVRVLRATGTDSGGSDRQHREFRTYVVLQGCVQLHRAGQDPVELRGGDTLAIPAGEVFALRAPTSDLELLEVAVDVG